MPRSKLPRHLPCSVPGCNRTFTNKGGLTNHERIHQVPRAQRSPARPPGPIVNDDFAAPFAGDYLPFEGEATPEPEQPQRDIDTVTFHPHINGLACDEEGNFLPEDSAPPDWEDPPPNDYMPFDNRASFELADLLFRRDQMSATNINDLLEIWTSTLPPDQDPPFVNKDNIYHTIDAIRHGDAPWQSFSVSYNEPIAAGDTTPWKHANFDVWYRDPRAVLHHQLANRDFAKEMDFAPKDVRDENGTRRYSDFMSGDWAWRQANELAKDDGNHGSVFCPIILGSDKTTVSVATGQNEYYPLYMSNGLVHNNVRRAHRNALTLIAFLAIPKTDKEHADSAEFRKFRRALFHASVNYILQSLKAGMDAYEVLRYADGFYRRTLYGIGPYIADYPEQVLLACIVQGWCPRCTARWDDLDEGEAHLRGHEHTLALLDALDTKTLWDDYGIVSETMPFTHGFPRADIHQILAPDLLHQIIKGTFKDHLVTWVVKYIEQEHTPSEAKKILADIDRRIATVPSFPSLRRFPQGRGFKQWTGDDSKALMKVFLPAIVGYVPDQMVRALSPFMEFCYLVRRSVLDTNDLAAIDAAVAKFHADRGIFDDVRPDGYSLPRQHSLVHYTTLIREFGAPNGLCSSITESKHIKAVKEPWRRSSRFEALGQMLVTNQRIDKLNAARIDFRERGMLRTPLFLPPDPLPTIPEEEDDDEDDDCGDIDGDIDSEVLLAVKAIPNVPRSPAAFGASIGVPHLPDLISRFLYEQEHLEELTDPNNDIDLDNIPLADCPVYLGKLRPVPSAIAIYYAPSDKSGTRGMFRERIRAVGSWRGGPARYDCVYVVHDVDEPGFKGLHVARVHSFFSINHHKAKYSCALVSWYSKFGVAPCPKTGMWMVVPDFDATGRRAMSVINIDSILRGAHLIGHAGRHRIPREFTFDCSLDFFQSFYVNKYIDHHAHEIAF